jgi:hypothetical protein
VGNQDSLVAAAEGTLHSFVASADSWYSCSAAVTHILHSLAESRRVERCSSAGQEGILWSVAGAGSQYSIAVGRKRSSADIGSSPVASAVGIDSSVDIRCFAADNRCWFAEAHTESFVARSVEENQKVGSHSADNHFEQLKCIVLVVGN